MARRLAEARAKRAEDLALRSVRAAGGVVVRRSRSGELELVVVHRPRYDDWSLPKGKCIGGETDEACALREVEEETGLRCELEAELARVSYTDSRGRPKSVRYWAMRAVAGELRPTREVDEARWLPADRAEDELSYERDRAVVRAAVSHAGAE